MKKPKKPEPINLDIDPEEFKRLSQRHEMDTYGCINSEPEALALIKSMLVAEGESMDDFTKLFKIGDGTAPNGWPAYRAYSPTPQYMVTGVECMFNGCGHIGSLAHPAKMECAGVDCHCTCCQMLAGKTVHGCTYG